MTSKLNTGKTVAAVAAAALCALSGVAQAQDKPLEVKFSGQVNRMLMYVDDGEQNTTFNADNINSSSRIRFVGSKEFMPGISAGANFEIEYTSQRSSSVSFGGRGTGSSPSFGERLTEAYIVGKQFGKISLGQGDGAVNGNMEISLSGTGVIAYAGTTDVGGGFRFRDGATVGPSVGNSINHNDFESRYDRVRYDTPALGPVVLSASYGNKGENSVFEFGGRLASNVPGGKVAGAAGWSERKKVSAATGDVTTVGGSLSYLSNMGFNVTVAYSVLSDDNAVTRDAKHIYGMLGYTKGMHAVAVQVGQSKSQSTNGDKGTVYGYVMTPVSWLELYGQVKQFDLSRTGANFDKVTIVAAGTRVKF
jgi:hypothetical protein